MTKDQEAKLLKDAKPCPFCLSNNLALVNCDTQVRGGLWAVGCVDCKAGGPMHNFPEETVELWNEAERKKV